MIRFSSDLAVVPALAQQYDTNESGKTVVKTTAVQLSSVKMAYKFAKVGSGRNALFYWLLFEQEDVTDFTLKAT